MGNLIIRMKNYFYPPLEPLDKILLDFEYKIALQSFKEKNEQPLRYSKTFIENRDFR